MKTVNYFQGGTPAAKVKDYTHTIPLSSQNILVFNCLTGKTWKGPEQAAGFGKRQVEEFQSDLQCTEKLLRFGNNAGMDKAPLSIVLIPSYGCNLSCTYCYEGKTTRNMNSWKTDDVPDVIEACSGIIQYHGDSISNTRFTFLGGEPIRRDTVPVVAAIIEKLKRMGGNNFSAVTNGFELSENITELAHRGLSEVMVTVDGPREIHDARRPSRYREGSSFDRVMDGIDACLDHGLPVTARVNIDQRNVPYLGELSEIFEHKGFYNHHLFKTYLYPITNDFAGNVKLTREAELARLLKAQSKLTPEIRRFTWNLHGMQFIYSIRDQRHPRPLVHFCGACGGNQYVIDYEFNLYTCWFGVGKSGFQIGKFRREKGVWDIDESLLNLWRSRNIFSIEQCKTCKWALFCGGGCGFIAFERTGRILAPNCADFDAIFEACGKIIYESV